MSPQLLSCLTIPTTTGEGVRLFRQEKRAPELRNFLIYTQLTTAVNLSTDAGMFMTPVTLCSASMTRGQNDKPVNK